MVALRTKMMTSLLRGLGSCYGWLILLIIGCTYNRGEEKILLVGSSTRSSSAWLRVLQRDLSEDFDQVQFGTVTSLNEDSLSKCNLIYLYHLSLQKLSPNQLNALDRFLLAGGHCIWVGDSGKAKDRYRSRIIGPLLSDHDPSPEIDKIQFKILELNASDTLTQSISACKESINHFGGINYDSLSIDKRPPQFAFTVDTLVMSMNEPIELEVLPNLDVLFIERGGRVGLLKEGSSSPSKLINLKLVHTQSNGLNGLAIAPDFNTSHHVYFSYLPAEEPSHQRVSRMTMHGDMLDASTEEIIMKIPIEFEYGWHGTNALEFDAKGNLYIGIGDFTLQSSEIAGYAQIDERQGHRQHDAQRTSANSNVYPGKILRIRPSKQGGYQVPENNLFGQNQDSAQTEIYVMGCRNPYRFTIDPHQGTLFFGDVGPDAWDDGDKGPRGYDELNVVRQPGFYGWPYFVADNKPYRDYNYETKVLGATFDPQNLTNRSPNNTGIRKLAAPRKPILWYHKGSTKEFPYLGMGGMNIMVGPKYYYEDFIDQDSPFPPYFDQKLFIYDWVRNWILLVSMTANDSLLQLEPFLHQHDFNKIMDMKFGKDGSLYVLEYGDEGYSANENATIKRIRYAPDNPQPASFDEIWTERNLPENDLPVKVGAEQGRYLIADGICLSCHHINQKIVGPSFAEISHRYPNDEESIHYLSRKIIDGGSGNWPGNIIMPANADLTMVQAQQIVKYIFSF